MKLFRGGYGDVWYYTVAKDVNEAIANIQVRYNMSFLPVTAQQIDDVDGCKIVAVEEKPVIEEKKPIKKAKE